ncbi:uncharacterized protein CDAR_20921 [Caerostris darwini]|uniref:Uncharacterized protein n=1 Tax=Caerostris darwini TaxID=1538125 RepID=A0AAV4MZQ3_9ARAC|nr:uncharacterized protein CDAR_20921 [Caerostris darwini]
MSIHPITLLFLIQIANSKPADVESLEQNHNFERNNRTDKDTEKPNQPQEIQRRQDEGFDLLKYFINGGSQQPQDAAVATQPRQSQQQPQQQQALSIQQQHQLQQQVLQLQQKRQKEQLQQLQHQQLQQLQQGRAANYPDSSALQQALPVSRNGGYGIGVGDEYAASPKEIAINIGGGKPVISIGRILPLLPKIFRALSTGGKVMFGVELGNNFYFGPVGAKPLKG